MDIYLPIAGQSVNALFIVALGLLVGVLSGMFGVGGGFLTTPLLIFYGIPPTVAVASAATQITGASVSGAMVHWRRGGVDLKMSLVMIVGGLFGSLTGAGLFRMLQATGQIDLVIGSLYVVLLGGIGGLMLKDALIALGYVPIPQVEARPRHNRWVASLPLRWRFYTSGLYVSPLAPLALGFVAGVLTLLLGIGGGFILVPLRPEAPPAPSVQAPRPIQKIKDPIRVASLDGQPARVAGLKSRATYEVVNPNTSPDLVWDPAKHDVVSGGDVIAQNVDRDGLSSIIDRMAAIRWLKMRSAQAPQDMKVFPNDKLHRTGEQVQIAIHGLAGRSLILFNIAGDGTLQFLYPKGSDPPVIENSEQRLTLQVREPFGAEQTVSVSATQRQTELEQAIRQLDRQRNPLKAAELVERYDGADVFVGLVGLFTAP